MENIKQKLFQSLFLKSYHRGFVEDVEVRLTDKTQASDPIKLEFYWMRTFGTLYPDGFNVESDY